MMVIFIYLIFIGSELFADISLNPVVGDQIMPNYGEEKKRIPGDNVVPHISFDHAGLQEVLKNASRHYSKIVDNIIEEEDSSSTVTDHPKPNGIKVKEIFRKEPTRRPVLRKEKTQGNDVKVFTENLKYRSKLAGLPTISLPSHSSALATINYGLKVSGDEKRRLALSLNYAFLGPNKAVVEMTGCGAFITVNSVTSTARLCGEVGDLTCRAPNGETFTIPFRAHVVDTEDNYECVKGKNILNGKLTAGMLAFLTDGTEQFGKAMAAAQVTTQVQTNNDNSVGVSGANVSGDKNKYIAGQSIAGATGRFLNWHLDFYQSMQPTTEVGGGHQVYLYTDGDAKIPKIFFVTDKKIKVNTSESLVLGE